MEYEALKMEIKDGIAWITLSRAKAMNALNVKMIHELADVVSVVNENSDVRVGIITGEGEKAFSAGADLQEINALTIKSAFDYSRLAHKVFSSIEESGKPMIAGIHGLAMGGGAELALCCHIRIAAENVKLSFPEAGLGGIPGMGGTQRLPRLIGKSRALGYLLTGEAITAEKGFEMGLFHKVVPIEKVKETAENMAKELAKKSPMSIKFIIQAVEHGIEIPLSEGLTLESALMAAISGSEDKKEGMKAIFERRAPLFKGE